MEELITTFHIDWKLLVAQLVNFIVVSFVLWRFALKPLMRTMAARSSTIEQSLKDAAAIEVRMKEAGADIEEKLREAKHQAVAIIETAKLQADAKRHEMLAAAKTEVEKVVAAARDQIQREQTVAVAGARAAVGEMVATGVAKVLGRELSASLDRKNIEARIKNLS